MRATSTPSYPRESKDLSHTQIMMRLVQMESLTTKVIELEAKIIKLEEKALPSRLADHLTASEEPLMKLVELSQEEIQHREILMDKQFRNYYIAFNSTLSCAEKAWACVNSGVIDSSRYGTIGDLASHYRSIPGYDHLAISFPGFSTACHAIAKSIHLSHQYIEIRTAAIVTAFFSVNPNIIRKLSLDLVMLQAIYLKALDATPSVSISGKAKKTFFKLKDLILVDGSNENTARKGCQDAEIILNAILDKYLTPTSTFAEIENYVIENINTLRKEEEVAAKTEKNKNLLDVIEKHVQPEQKKEAKKEDKKGESVIRRTRCNCF